MDSFNMFRLKGLLTFLCVASILTDALAEKDEEIMNNKVMVMFYDLTDSKWSDKKENFQKAVADYTSAYCKDNLDMCELANWMDEYEFGSADVLQYGDSESDGATLTVHIYVQFNDALVAAVNDTTDTSYILVKAALEEVLIDHRSDIGDDADLTIVGIGNAEYPRVPDKRLNTIMIIVGFAVLLILIITWIGLYYWKKRTDKSMKKRKREERLKKQQKARSPTFSSVSKSKVVPVMDEDNKDNKGSQVPAEAAYHSPTPYNFTVSPPSVNHTQDMHPHHGPAKAEKRVQIMRSNFFSEEKQDVESGNRSLDTPDDQKNRSMDSNADAAGATAVFQAHSIDSHNDSYERKKKKHKKKKSKHSEEMEQPPAVITMEAEPQEKSETVQDNRQESDSDNGFDMSRIGYRMC